jgi:mannosyltransferase
MSQRGDQLDWIAPMSVGGLLASPGDVFGSTAAGLFVIGLALTVRWQDRVVRELAVLAAVPPVVLMAVSFVTSSLWVPRYVMFVLFAFALLAAASLSGLRARTAAALLLLVAISLPAHREVRGAASHHGPNFRAIAQVISREQQPGDGLVYGRTGTWSLRAGIDYQLRRGHAPRDLLLSRPAAEVGTLDAKQCPEAEACIGATRRVWFVKLWQSDDPLRDAGQAERVLREEYRQVNLWTVAKGTVALYQHR